MRWPNSSTKGRYGLEPITTDTWAGPMKPWIATGGSLPVLGASRMARIADGVRTWLQKIEKFSSPFFAASFTAMAVGGVVVSKPMAKNTTSRSGNSSAMRMASSVE